MRTENERPVFCFLKQGTFVRTYPNVTEAAKDINYSRATVIGHISGRTKSVGDFVFSYENKFPGYSHIKNTQLNVDRFSSDGVYQCTYSSVAAAAAATGIDPTRIYRCIHEKRDMDTGYLWQYRKKKIPDGFQPVPTFNRFKIFQFDTNGKLINSFNSASEAAKQTGIDRRQINRCCLKQAQTAGGFKWATSYFANLPKTT